MKKRRMKKKYRNKLRKVNMYKEQKPIFKRSCRYLRRMKSGENKRRIQSTAIVL